MCFYLLFAGCKFILELKNGEKDCQGELTH